jgi:hypothetical protein
VTEPSPTPEIPLKPLPTEGPDYRANPTPAPGTDLISRGPSGVIAVAAVILAAAPLYLFFRNGIFGGVDALHPPSLLAVNLSFCAVIMAVLAIFRGRGIANQRPVLIASLVAAVLGLAGPVIFFSQGMHWRRSIEFGELARAQHIAHAARLYAETHRNKFPPSLVPLVLAKETDPWHLPPEDLISPFRPTPQLQDKDIEALRKDWASSPDKAEELLQSHSDYMYLGADLPDKTDNDVWLHNAGQIIIVTGVQRDANDKVIGGFDPRIGVNITLGMASGDSKFVLAPDMGKALEASNEARKAYGLPPMDDFAVIKKKPTLPK